MNQRKIEYWVIPPKKNSEFVAAMEDILDLYKQPHDEKNPVVCMDEQPVQLINEVKIPVSETKEHPKRVDYEYERNGTASIFMFTEALKGWRKVEVREHRKKVDWAIEVASLLETRYSNVEKLILVCDNLNTHTKGAFYEAFEPEKAREIIKRLEIRHTPKHGSWLNIAENELSSMTRQSLKFRIGTIEKLRKQVQDWAEAINKEQRGVDWQFTTSDARIKLKSLYPKI
jgi:hypothetical protein